MERALGKLGVSLGESGGFVRGKSEFPLRKVQGAEKAEKGRLGLVKDLVNFVDMGGCNDCFSYGLYGLYGFSFTFC